nr:unnamed protein product [Digitaria exilis]
MSSSSVPPSLLSAAGAATASRSAVAVVFHIDGYSLTTSLLDFTGNAAYELPAERGVFVAPPRQIYGHVVGEGDDGGKNPATCGYVAFITKEDLGRRRESLVRENSLAIRCDVGVVVVETIAVGPKQQGNRRQRMYGGGGGYSSDDGYEFDDEDDGGGSRGDRRGQPPPNDKEFIRRCLVAHRRK